MKTLKKAMVVCAAAGSLAIAVPGVASAGQGSSQGNQTGVYAGFYCDLLGARPSYYHGQCLSSFTRH